MKLKYKYFRLLINFRNWRNSFGDKFFSPDPIKINSYEEKATRLWKILVKDEDTKLSYNSSNVRQIEKQNIFMILQPSHNRHYILTLMDVTTNRSNLYELRINHTQAEHAIDYFDYELEKRMKKVETNKRNIIETDIDKLLENEERSMIQKLKK